MPFQKTKGLLKKKRDELDNLIYKLKKHDARWYTSQRCGWCLRQKHVFKEIDNRLFQFLREDVEDVPDEIKGFPCLYIPNDKGDPLIFPGFKTKDKILEIVSNLS